MKRILFDSDLIGDDLLTLIAMTADNSVRLEAVTAYGRRIGAVGRCRIAQELLEILNVANVDLVPGSDRPLVQNPIPGCQFCDFVIDRMVRGEYAKDHTERKRREYHNTIVEGIHAAQYLIDKTKDAPGIYSLICTGPLTNIALAVSIDPSFPERLAEVVVMGGVWSVSGNSGPKAEANIYNDPEAARIVFDRFKNIVVVPLDVTLQVAFERSEAKGETHGSQRRSFFHSDGIAVHDTDMRLFLDDLVNSCCDAHLEKHTGDRMPLHDLLAFLVLTDRSLVNTKRCSIHVETRSNDNRGMMVFDFLHPDYAHELAVDVDADRALKAAYRLLENV
jgi:purine nucleosidase